MEYNILPRYENLSLIDQVLYNRGLTTPEQRFNFLHSTPVIYDPSQLDNINQALFLLADTIMSLEKIYIQVDCDCDGYTSAALFINYLYRIFPTVVDKLVVWNLHEDKKHGISMEKIPEGTKLVIVPDASSNEADIHKQLTDKGIKVIVLDHHNAEIPDNETACIVNNQICNYPNKNLSGVGIVYQFCKLMDQYLNVKYADDYLDLVAVGNCGDMMDYREPETHYYINEGFKNINNIFLREFITTQEFSMKGKVSPFTVSWYVVPYINAMARTGTIEEKEMLFQSLLDFKAETLVSSNKRGEKGEQVPLVKEAVRICGLVKARQEKLKKEILDKIDNSSYVDNSCGITIICMPHDKIESSENLNGLIANQLMGKNHIPAFVLQDYVDEDGVIHWRGSARGIDTNCIHNWRQFIEDSGLADYAQGHENAFGVSFESVKLEEFKKYLKNYLSKNNTKLVPHQDIDFEFDANDLNLSDKISELAQYKHIWGQNIGEPKVKIKNIKISKNTMFLLGKGTLKINIPRSNISAIKFNATEMYDDLIGTALNNEEITIYGTCDLNEYPVGVFSPQIKLDNYEVQKQLLKWIF